MQTFVYYLLDIECFQPYLNIPQLTKEGCLPLATTAVSYTLYTFGRLLSEDGLAGVIPFRNQRHMRIRGLALDARQKVLDI
jgi:hypothetical protein